MKRLGIALAGAAAAALAAAVAAGSAVRPGAPQLLRASASGNHVVAVARFAHGATPRLIEVARSPRLAGLGFVSGIVLRESISAAPTPSGLVRLVTRGRIPAGRYWVAVSSVDVGLTSCLPLKPRRGGDCLAEWSGPVRLTVR